jgi:hypothetical protein
VAAGPWAWAPIAGEFVSLAFVRAAVVEAAGPRGQLAPVQGLRRSSGQRDAQRPWVWEQTVWRCPLQRVERK